MTKKGFEELLITGKLPSPAGVGMRILEMTRSETFSIEEMGETIRLDSALTGRILKLANSAANTGVQPATTVKEAIMRLGSRPVRDLALAFSLISERKHTGCKAFDFERYWAKSLARAVCAQSLCVQVQQSRGRALPSQEAYICGLLGEIGRLALASVYPEKYSDLITAGAINDPDRLAEVESEAFGIDHRQLAESLVLEWGLPENFSIAVRDYSRRLKDENPVPFGDMTSVLRHAETLAAVFVATPNTTRVVWERCTAGLDRLALDLGIDEPGLESFFDRCVREWVSWGEETGIIVQRDVRYQKAREAARNAVAGAEDVSTAVHVAPTLSEGVEEVPTAEPRTDPIHILAVDDEPIQRKLLTKYLAQEGYRITLACDGKEALRIALEQSPDIVVADYIMPEMDGMELCRLLRKTDAGSRMYFILLTSRTEPEVLIEAFDTGSDDFVTKPYAPRLLLARIKGGVRIVRLQRKVDADRVTMERQMAELGVLTRKLRNAAMTDALTNLPNRRYAIKRLDNEWAFTQRTGRPLTLIMVDIDNFKNVNDTHGHEAGDVVLIETAKVLKDTLRETDEVCRLGGEEFLILCRNTPPEDGVIVAERLRKAVAANTVQSGSLNRAVTISLGIAGWRPGVESALLLLKLADGAVYEAKRKGRNCFSLAGMAVEQKKSA